MQSASSVSYRIEIHQADIAKWFATNSSDVNPLTIGLSEGKDGEVVVCIPVSLEYMDKFLRSVLKDLPEFGQYDWGVLPHSKDIVAVITWKT
jgi:hypothetical protein